MQLQTYDEAQSFLEKTHDYLVQHEIAAGLLLGLAIRLKTEPNAYGEQSPFYATVEDDAGLVLVSLMTPPHNLIVFSDHDDYRLALELLVDHLRASQWALPGALGVVPVVDDFVAMWVGTDYLLTMNERVFELRSVEHPDYGAGSMRVATEADLETVVEWTAAFTEEAVAEMHDLDELRRNSQRRIGDGALFVWEVDGAPVSMAAKTRPTLNGITISYVYTPPEHRRKGYATALVAKLSQLLLDEGYQFCSLFTDLANPTSNSIYQKIGYRPVCDFNQYTFGD